MHDYALSLTACNHTNHSSRQSREMLQDFAYSLPFRNLAQRAKARKQPFMQCNTRFRPKPNNLSPNQPQPTHSVESRWSASGKDLLASSLGHAVRKGEFEVLGEELLDVWALDIIGLLELDDREDLGSVSILCGRVVGDLTYVNGTETGAMSGSHILVHSLNSIGS